MNRLKPEMCSTSCSATWVFHRLLDVAVLHEIQEEPKTGQHPLEKLNVFSNFCLLGQGARALFWRMNGWDTTQNFTSAETGSFVNAIMEGQVGSQVSGWTSSILESVIKQQQVINPRF